MSRDRQERGFYIVGRPSCSRPARGSPVRALRRRGSRRSPLLAPSPLPGFLRDLALRAGVRCRCTLRCAAAREEEGRPRRPCFGFLYDLALGLRVLWWPCRAPRREMPGDPSAVDAQGSSAADSTRGNAPGSSAANGTRGSDR